MLYLRVLLVAAILSLSFAWYLIVGLGVIGWGLSVGCLLPGFPGWFCFAVFTFGCLAHGLFVLWVYGFVCVFRFVSL